jgi:hypothetical protein
MVQEEYWIDRRREDVARVAPDAEMACGVQAKETVGEAPLKPG